MEPLILTLRPNASYKNFKPSESDTFIYCLNGEVSLQLGNQVYKACKEDVLFLKRKINIAYITKQIKKLRF